MTSQSSSSDTTHPESRSEDGTEATTESSAARDEAAAAPGKDDSARRDSEATSSSATPPSPSAPLPSVLPQEAGESVSLSELEAVPSSGTVTVEIVPEIPRPPTPPSQRPKIARQSTAEPLGVTATLPPPGWPPRVIGDLMTRKIVTMREDEPIGDLEKAMDRFQFHHVPVVTSDMKLVGLITRTDLLRARLGVRSDTGGPVTPVDASTHADAIMRRNVVVGRVDYPLTTACRLMLDNSLPCLPVVREGGYLLGILTQSDFTRLALAVLEHQSRQ